LSREYCATLFTGFRAAPGPVDDLEERVLKFREQHPEIVLDPLGGEETEA
jgi:pyridoxal/pyridoxine/pyridoxamine kinase